MSYKMPLNYSLLACGSPCVGEDFTVPEKWDEFQLNIICFWPHFPSVLCAEWLMETTIWSSAERERCSRQPRDEQRCNPCGHLTPNKRSLCFVSDQLRLLFQVSENNMEKFLTEADLFVRGEALGWSRNSWFHHCQTPKLGRLIKKFHSEPWASLGLSLRCLNNFCCFLFGWN